MALNRLRHPPNHPANGVRLPSADSDSYEIPRKIYYLVFVNDIHEIDSKRSGCDSPCGAEVVMND